MEERQLLVTGNDIPQVDSVGLCGTSGGSHSHREFQCLYLSQTALGEGLGHGQLWMPDAELTGHFHL